MADRLPSLHAARQAALMTLALPSTVDRLGQRRARALAREVWLAGTTAAAGRATPTPQVSGDAQSHGSPAPHRLKG